MKPKQCLEDMRGEGSSSGEHAFGCALCHIPSAVFYSQTCLGTPRCLIILFHLHYFFYRSGIQVVICHLQQNIIIHMHLPTRIKMKTEKSKDNLFSFINEQPSVNKSQCFTEGSFLLFGFHYHLIFGSSLENFVW